MWYNNYVGIPYQNKGRDRSGVDCWGLVRLVYKQEYGVDLPSFAESYENSIGELIEEAVNENKESWYLTDKPETGDIILFNILGHDSHLGIYVGNNYFLHAAEGAKHSVIEKLTSVSWSRRIRGYYRYRENAEALLTGHAHPLRRETFQETFSPGITAEQIVNQIKQRHEIYNQTTTECLLFINGKRIPESEFANTRIKENDKIEYRSLLKGSRTILTLALLAATVTFGAALGAAFQTAATGVATTVAGSTTIAGITVGTATVSAGWAAAGAIAINIAGNLLINQIAPIREAKTTDPGQPQAADLFSGGSNQLTPYASIPVVLGTMRYTPPLGAQQVVEFEEIAKNRLNSLVVWGFGPLRIEDIQIGTKSFSDFTDNPRQITYSGYDTEDPNITDEIYKSDIKQATIASPITIQNIWIESQEADGETDPAVLRNIAQVDLDQEVDKLKIAIHFPEGLRTVKTRGNNAGTSSSARFAATYTYQKLDANLNPIGSEISNTAVIAAKTWEISPQITQEFVTGGQGNDYYETVNLYRWIGIFLLPDNTVTLSYGAPTLSAASSEMEQSLVDKLYSTQYTSTVQAPVSQSITRNIIPQQPAIGAVELYRFRVLGNQGLISGSLIDFTSTFQSSTGLSLTISEPSSFKTGRLVTVSLSAGTAVIGPGIRGLIQLGGEGEKYYKHKDAFTHVEELTVEKSRYRIKIQRNIDNYSNSDLGLEPVPITTSDQEIHYKQYNKAFLYAVTGYSTDTKPINTIPGGVTIAKTALSILSNKNLNGNLEGINALVTSVCRDYDPVLETWDNLQPTNNPASLFLHILTHPANAYRITTENEAQQINFEELAIWWEYCTVNAFSYNNIITATTSVLDLLKDIAAAGRASPTVIDGKWSVIIDKPRSIITQYFTPHNSWGFEGSKALPRQPHAFRINFRNQAKAYQDDSIIVPNIGYSIATAQIIEEITIPGITDSVAAKKHAQWHLAQIRLRPEVYTINTDIEYLVCTRGDLVRVSHDVPRWGIGTGRIKTIITVNSQITGVELDNEIYLDSNNSYKVLFRTETNQTIERIIQAIQTSNYYNTITFTEPLALDTIKSQELFIIGQLGQETQELIVLAIEPQPGNTARIVLTDYSPQIYSIDFDAEYPEIIYNPNYVKPPKDLMNSFTENQKPVITLVYSDDRASDMISPGVYKYNIKIAFATFENLPLNVKYVQCEYIFSSEENSNNTKVLYSEFSSGTIVIPDVMVGEEYKFRLRYVTEDSRFSEWTAYQTHTVVGRETNYGDVDSVSVTRSRRFLNITPVIDPLPSDFNYFEIRIFKDSGTGDFWDSNNVNIFKTTTTGVAVVDLLNFSSPRISEQGIKYRIACRAVDTAGNYSNSSGSALTSITITTIPD
jgi:hypothetical protein